MYSTNIKDNCYLVRCLIVSNYVSSEEFIVNTGAAYTCCHYKAVNDKLSEVFLQIVNLKVYVELLMEFLFVFINIIYSSLPLEVLTWENRIYGLHLTKG